MLWSEPKFYFHFRLFPHFLFLGREFHVMISVLYTDKKENKISLIYKKFRIEQLQRHIWLTASSYIRKPFLIYDFATAPLWIFFYMRKIRFSFLSVYYTTVLANSNTLFRQGDGCLCALLSQRRAAQHLRRLRWTTRHQAGHQRHLSAIFSITFRQF